jgi:hypothetical protein
MQPSGTVGESNVSMEVSFTSHWLATTVVGRNTSQYIPEFCEIWTREWLLWQGVEAVVLVNCRPIFWWGRMPHSKKVAIVWQKNLIMGSIWKPDIKIYWPTDRRSKFTFKYNFSSKVVRYYFWTVLVDATTDGQWTALSWCRTPLWGKWQDFLFLSNNWLILRVGYSLWREDRS